MFYWLFHEEPTHHFCAHIFDTYYCQDRWCGILYSPIICVSNWVPHINRYNIILKPFSRMLPKSYIVPFFIWWILKFLDFYWIALLKSQTLHSFGLPFSIALLLDSLLLRGVSPRPAFRPSRGRAWCSACLRRCARYQKQGLAVTPRNNRLSNGRAMALTYHYSQELMICRWIRI